MNPLDALLFKRLFLRAVEDVVLPYLRSVLIQIQDDPAPVKALARVLKENRGVPAAVAGVLAGAGGAAAGGGVAVATMGFWTGIGYWMGLVSLPLLWPIVGALVAFGGVGAGVYALLSKLSDGDKLRLAKLYAHTYTVIVFADGIKTKQEGEQITIFRDRLVSMGLKTAVVDSIFLSAPQTPDAFEFNPSDFTKDQLQMVMTEAWIAAVAADSAGPREADALDRICARLAMGDMADTIRSKVTKITLESVRRTPAVAAAAAYSAPDIANSAASIFDALLNADFTGNARTRRGEILSSAITLGAAAAAISVVASGHPEALSIVAEGYAVARTAADDDPNAVKRVRKRSLELLSRLNVDQKQANEYLANIDSVLDDTRKQAQKAANRRGLRSS